MTAIKTRATKAAVTTTELCQIIHDTYAAAKALEWDERKAAAAVAAELAEVCVATAKMWEACNVDVAIAFYNDAARHYTTASVMAPIDMNGWEKLADAAQQAARKLAA